MILVYVDKLSGTALDWAVAKCEQLPIVEDPMGFKRDAPDSSQCGFWVWDEDKSSKGKMWLIGKDGNYSPSTDWRLGGQIIDREGVNLLSNQDSHDKSSILTLAMRGYVKKMAGEQIEVPKKLVGNSMTITTQLVKHDEYYKEGSPERNGDYAEYICPACGNTNYVSEFECQTLKKHNCHHCATLHYIEDSDSQDNPHKSSIEKSLLTPHQSEVDASKTRLDELDQLTDKYNADTSIMPSHVYARFEQLMKEQEAFESTYCNW